MDRSNSEGLLRFRIDREKLLGVRYAAQRVSSYRDEATFNIPPTGKRCRYQNRLIDRTAHRRDAACLVNGRANDGKIQPFAATDIAIEDFADMQTEIHVGHRLAVRRPPLFQLGDTA